MKLLPYTELEYYTATPVSLTLSLVICFKCSELSKSFNVLPCRISSATLSKFSSAYFLESCFKIQSSLGICTFEGSFLTASQSALCHLSRVDSPVFWTFRTRSYRIRSYTRTARGTLSFPAERRQLARVTPSSIA